jgi:hypothetical protein
LRPFSCLVASIAKPGKVGRWRAGKRGNEPSFASDGQRGEAAAVRGIKTDGSRGGPTEAATELLPPTRSPLGARSARNLAAGQCSALPFPLQRNPAPLFYFPHAQPGVPPASASPRFLRPVLSSSRLALHRLSLTVVLLLGTLASLLGVLGVVIASRFHQPRSRFFPQSLTVSSPAAAAALLAADLVLPELQVFLSPIRWSEFWLALSCFVFGLGF